MRGDSIRDLYAKTLALLGLGVLAGTGALVDYWPSRVTLPAAESPWSVSLLPGPLLAGAVDVPPAPVTPAEPILVADVRPERPSEPRPLPRPTPTVRTVAFNAAGIGQPATMTGPTSAVDALDTWAWTEMSRDPSLDTIVESLIESEPLVALPAPRRTGEASAESDGLLTSAFKKTGSSIAKGGAKTGASIASAGASILDGIRAVSDLFKRALPND